ncbi:MAG: AMP-dependent synthetase/ligase [Nocardioides sp.]
MREYCAPLEFDLPVTGSLTDDIVANAETAPERVAFSRRIDAGWEDVTALAFHERVRAVAKGLVAEGIEIGERVALLSRTRFEWTLVDYALWYVGAVTVPVYETASADQLEWLLADSGATAVVVESAAHRVRLEPLQQAMPRLRHAWTLDDGGLDDLEAAGQRISEQELDQRRDNVTPASVATIIYTSGTSGHPKGCALTHGNFMIETRAALSALDGLFQRDDSATLLFLPLAHVFARLIQVGAVKAGVRLGHAPDIRTLNEALPAFKPTFLLAVPRVFEKLFNAASQSARIDGRGRAFDKAVDTAIAYSKALDGGRTGVILRGRHALADKTVYARIRAALGGECTYAISGGSPLGERLGHFYRGIGVPVLEGYGLTETTAAVTVNRPGLVRVGSVGQPLPGTTVRVADDGELLIRGGQVMTGYWQNAEATREVISSDGWFHTGDLGVIDDEGFVWVTGRQKELLVTAGGKNVAPGPLEERIRSHPMVSQCMVLGDGRPFVSALITLDAAAAAQFARERGKPADVASLATDPDVRREIQSAVDAANQAVSQAESVRQFAVLASDWSEESGELTPSLKVRRDTVLKRYRGAIENMYDH